MVRRKTRTHPALMRQTRALPESPGRVIPGTFRRNPEHATFGAPSPTFGGRKRERKTGEPPRPAKNRGKSRFCCLTTEYDPWGGQRREQCAQPVRAIDAAPCPRGLRLRWHLGPPRGTALHCASCGTYRL